MKKRTKKNRDTWKKAKEKNKNMKQTKKRNQKKTDE